MTTVNTKYAVDLSNEGVSLWCRGKKSTWKLLGKIALDAPDFSEQIEALKTGHSSDKDEIFTTQVRIPASEVFVSEIDLMGATGTVLSKKIKSFLEENTPYKYDDLVFDHVDKSGDGKAYIAAVTKQTISEAKEFISAYGFDAQYYTTKLEKADFPRIPKFYDGDKPSVEKTTPPTVAPPPKAPTPPATLPEPAIPQSADLSGFSTVRSKTVIASRDTDQQTNALNTPPPPPRRISIDLPKPKFEKIQTSALPQAQPIKSTTQPFKMPQGDAVEAETTSFIKPKYLLYITAVILLALAYWFFTVLFDGKEEITRLQQTPLNDPPLISEPKKLTQQSPQDTTPVLAGDDVEIALNTPPLVQVPIMPEKPALNIIVEAPPKLQTKPSAPTPASEVVSTQTTVTRTDTSLETTTDLAAIDSVADVPTVIPEPETLLATPDPLKDILPKMRSQDFETLHKAEIETLQTELAIVDELALPEPVETEDAPSLLDLADVSLKSNLPKIRPASIAAKAKQARNSLVAKADPALASKKPKRRPSNLIVLKKNKEVDTVDEIALAVQTAVLAQKRPRIRPKNLKKNANIKTASLSEPSKTGNAVPITVQKEATEKAGFSKRRISLIGVYGTNSDRRALVRMPSGRYVKIKPGQSFSGWNVAAIGESSVRITKGSRNQVLRMPK
jgi:hypothetical protein